MNLNLKDPVEMIDNDPGELLRIAPPSSSITFVPPDGRSALIDFGGESIVYSGDLSVDVSAKLFFEALGITLI